MRYDIHQHTNSNSISRNKINKFWLILGVVSIVRWGTKNDFRLAHLESLAPGKYKFRAWLVIQNKVWTFDWFAIRGWQNNRLCPLCRREGEMALHLVVSCRYTKRIWSMLAVWVAYQQLDPREWDATQTGGNL